MNKAPVSHTYYSQRLRLHYVDWGNSTAPVMLFVHGVRDHCRTWDKVAAHFADDFRVVAPDLRGHGDSEWLRGSSYHYLDYLYDLHQLVHQARLSPMTLVGHSMGGAVAALFAGVYPELVSRLIVIEGIGLWSAMQPPASMHEKVRQWIRDTRNLAARRPRRYATLDEAYQRMQQANPHLSDDQALHLTMHGSNQNEDGTFSWKYDSYTYNFSPGGVNADETTSLWQRINCPVQVINADDGLEHRIGHGDTMQYFSKGELHVIEQAGHWTYHDKHREVVELIAEFVQRP